MSKHAQYSVPNDSLDEVTSAVSVSDVSLDSIVQIFRCPRKQSEETGEDNSMQVCREDASGERVRLQKKDQCQVLQQLSPTVLVGTGDGCFRHLGDVEEVKVIEEPQHKLGNSEEVVLYTRTEDHPKQLESPKMNRVSSHNWLVERAEGSETIKMSEVKDIQLIVTEPMVEESDSGEPICKIRQSTLDIKLKPTADAVDHQSLDKTGAESSYMKSSNGDSDDQPGSSEGSYMMPSHGGSNGQTGTQEGDELVQLDEREMELATSLRKRAELEGGTKSCGDILREMGNIHKRRGLLTTHTQWFVTASALYNAALMRTEEPELIKNLETLIRQNEIAFCETLSLPTTKLPIYFKCEVKEKLESMRRRVSPNAECLLNTFAKELSLEAADTVRMQVEKVFVDDTLRMFKEVCSDLKSFDQYLISKSKDILGQPPQEYTAIAMGSLARGEATPYSDLEWAILVQDDSEDLEYFRNMTRLVQIFVLNIGETYLRTLSIKSLNDYDTPGGNWFVDDVVSRGFEFDSAAPYACKTPLGRPDAHGRPGIELIRTPEHMAEICEINTAIREGYLFDRVLTTTVKIDGSDSLFERFTFLKTGHKLDIAVQVKAYYEIQDLVKKFWPKLSFHSEVAGAHDIKQELFRLPTVVISLFKTLFSLDNDNTWDLLDEMRSKGQATQHGAHNLKVIISIVSLMRLVMYCTKGQQSELLNLLPRSTSKPGNSLRAEKTLRYNKYRNLIKRYYYSIYPFINYLMDIKFLLLLFLQKLDSNFYEVSGFFEGCIEYCSFQYSKARDKLLSHFALWEKLLRSNENNGDTVSSDSEDSAFKTAVDCLYIAGKTYMMEERYVHALKYFTDALQMVVSHGELRYKASAALVEKNVSRETHDLLFKAFDDDYQTNIAMLKAEIGNANTHLKNWKLALACYQEALDIMTRLGEEEHRKVIALLFNDIGMVYCAFAKYELALENCHRSLNLLTITHGDTGQHKETGVENSTHGSVDHFDIAFCLQCIGDVYGDMGKYQTALQYSVDALDMLKRIYGDADNLSTVGCLQRVGEAHNAIGHYELALQFYEDSYSMLVRLLGGVELPCIASKLQVMARVLCEMGKHERALENCRECLYLVKRLYSDQDHCNVALTLQTTGRVYFESNLHELALQHFREAYGVLKRIHGNGDDTGIVSVANDIGSVYCATMTYQLALEQYHSALGMAKRIYGDGDALIIAFTLHNIAKVHHRLNEHKVALRHYRDSLNMRRRIYMEGDHPSIAKVLLHIGDVYCDMSKPNVALEYYQDGLTMMKRIFGDVDHPDIASSLNCVGMACFAMGEYDVAMQCYEKSLAMGKAIDGEQGNPNTATCLNNMANVCDAACQYELALQYHKESLHTLQIIYGQKDFPEISTCLKNVGCDYVKLGQYDLALQYYQNSLDMKLRMYGQAANIDIASILGDIGVVYNDMGELRLALQFKLKSLKMMKELCGDHPNVADACCNIGWLYKDIGMYEKAMVHYFEYLDIIKRLYGSGDSLDMANFLNNAGEVYLKMGKLDEARGYCRRSLDMFRQLFGLVDHTSIAETLGNLGLVQGKLGLETGLQTCLESLEMFKRLLGCCDHMDIASSLKNVGVCYKLMGDTDLALQHCKDALEMRRRLDKDGGHQYTADILRELGALYLSKGDTDMALRHYLKAIEMRERLGCNGDNEDNAAMLSEVSEVYMRTGDSGLSDDYLENSKKMLARLSSPVDDTEPK